MKASIIAANALLVVGMASIYATSPDRPIVDAGRSAVASSTIHTSVCRDAVWPYVLAECRARSVVRFVRNISTVPGR